MQRFDETGSLKYKKGNQTMFTDENEWALTLKDKYNKLKEIQYFSTLYCLPMK